MSPVAQSLFMRGSGRAALLVVLPLLAAAAERSYVGTDVIEPKSHSQAEVPQSPKGDPASFGAAEDEAEAPQRPKGDPAPLGVAEDEAFGAAEDEAEVPQSPKGDPAPLGAAEDEDPLDLGFAEDKEVQDEDAVEDATKEDEDEAAVQEDKDEAAVAKAVQDLPDDGDEEEAEDLPADEVEEDLPADEVEEEAKVWSQAPNVSMEDTSAEELAKRVVNSKELEVKPLSKEETAAAFGDVEVQQDFFMAAAGLDVPERIEANVLGGVMKTLQEALVQRVRTHDELKARIEQETQYSEGLQRQISAASEILDARVRDREELKLNIKRFMEELRHIAAAYDKTLLDAKTLLSTV